MIEYVSIVSVYVVDQQRALEFYRDKLGFSVVMDVEMGPGMRWLTVLPPKGQTQIVLYQAGDNAQMGQKPAGGWSSMVWHTSDIEETYRELTALGVTMTAPKDVPWGRDANITDPDGNVFNVVEPSR